MTIKMNAFTVQSHGFKHEFAAEDVAKWTDEFIQNAVEQGIKIRLDRVTASMKGKSPDEKLVKCKELAASLRKGIVPKGGKSRESLDNDGTALKFALEKRGCNKGTLAERLDAYTIGRLGAEPLLKTADEIMEAKNDDEQWTGIVDQIMEALRKSKAYKAKMAELTILAESGDDDDEDVVVAM